MQNSRDSWFLLKSKPTVSRDVIDKGLHIYLNYSIYRQLFVNYLTNIIKYFGKTPVKI